MFKFKSIFTFTLLFVMMVLFHFTHSGLGIASMAENDEFSEEDTRLDTEAYYLLFNRDYKTLEQRFKSYIDAYAGGKITAEDISNKFDRFLRTPGLEAQFNEWINTYPRSYSARLARGIYHIANAWVLRGGKFAGETSDDQFQRFSGELKNAQSDIEASLNLFSRPIESYRYLIRVSKGLSLEKEREFLDEALKIDPKAFYPRSEYLSAITPKWGGNNDLMAEFINASKKSQMNAKLMNRLESDYYSYLAEQSYLDKDFKTSSAYYLKSYMAYKRPGTLYKSGRAANDGGFKDLAFSLFDELAKKHTKYPTGFTERGYLYESYFKDYDKAINDYLIASDLGNSWAQNRIGWFYMTGTHVKTDLVKAEKYLIMAIRQNDKTALANLDVLNNLKKNSLKYNLSDDSYVVPKLNELNIHSYAVLNVDLRVDWLNKRGKSQSTAFVDSNIAKIERMLKGLGYTCLDRSKIIALSDDQKLSVTNLSNEKVQQIGRLLNADAVIVATIPSMGINRSLNIYYENIDIKAISVASGQAIWNSRLNGSVDATDLEANSHMVILDSIESKLYDLLQSKLKSAINQAKEER